MRKDQLGTYANLSPGTLAHKLLLGRFDGGSRGSRGAGGLSSASALPLTRGLEERGGTFATSGLLGGTASTSLRSIDVRPEHTKG